ncbi:sulfatase [Parabacteroides bouchesdurhonensis]|uniref:sulfatase family protein n=1 Tax=Parabacteroides bouchesdurhonensis TaxID=1936995 RepID=UPI000C859033|nr:sulfatase [Parabacteroides bouchesdurhonensis]
MNLNKRILGVGFLLSGVALTAQGQSRPNLIYVFADQLRADVLGYAGDAKAVTPNIDGFARQAVNFKNAVSVTPVSAPYRSCLFTGKYTSSTGFIINEINMNPNHRTIAHILGDAGYDLGYVGKMHLNDQHHRSYKPGPERMGFDGYWAGYSFNHESYKAYYYTDGENGEEVEVDLKGQYGPDVFTGLAVDYIKKEANKDKPFALFLSWNPTHDPWVKENVQEHCYEKFKNTQFELPPNFKNVPDKYMDRYPQEFFDGDSAWKESFTKGGGYQETMRCYYSMVNSIDEQFGHVLSVIDSLGLADNTIVVFTSDHGEMFASQGRMYKLTFYDEAARIPFLIRYPKVQTEGESDVCLNTPDITPTLLGLMGLNEQIPQEMEGKDLSFILRHEKGEEPAFAFMQGMGHTYQWKDGFEWRAVRDKRYTYAKYLRDGSELLFDREKDPYMTENVIGKKEYASVLKKLRKEMTGKMAELNDEFKPCTWYRDHWMYKNYSIKAAAHGEFGPLPPIEPYRTKD